MSRRGVEFDLGRRNLLFSTAPKAVVYGLAAKEAADIVGKGINPLGWLKDGVKEGLERVIDGLNPFTPEEAERVDRITREKLVLQNEIGLVRRPYVIKAEKEKGWKYVPRILAGEEVVVTSRWFADWRLKGFSDLSREENVLVVPDQRLVVLTIPRPSVVEVFEDPEYKTRIQRRRGAGNSTLGLGTLVEEHDLKPLFKETAELESDNDAEAAERADAVAKFTLESFCSSLLLSAGCLNANFRIAFRGEPTIFDPNLKYSAGIVGVQRDGPPVPQVLYSPPEVNLGDKEKRVEHVAPND